jgi:hypothetical protein
MAHSDFAKGGPLRVLLMAVLLFCCADVARAQRVTSYGIGVGGTYEEDARATAAFSMSGSVHWWIPWLGILQRTVAELNGNAAGGTVRDVSFALMPAWEPAGGRLVLAAGGSLHSLHRELLQLPDVHETRPAFTAAAGLRVPFAGDGVLLELLARADLLNPAPQFSAVFGVRVRPGLPNTLTRGERLSAARVAAHQAVWNDVLMQLILLQQNLESFTRIRELETGIDLEFNERTVTMYDDLARVARVLAAADPPVTVTVFAPNSGRAAAAVTAGSFPAERLHMQRDTRVYLRVER